MKTKELLKIFDNAIMHSVLSKYSKTADSKKEYAFNIFSLSTYGTQLENFHSDIIAALIDPKAGHREGDLLLKSFLIFLNRFHNANINFDDFKTVEVFRERGRLDIAIIDKKTKKALIIENKINHAPDMANQLDRYYNWCIRNDYKVVAVVYLTLTGEKTAPLIDIEDSVKPINIAAFLNTEYDLANGWVSNSIGNCSNMDTSSMLIQYKKLLIYLGYKKMNTEALNMLYKEADNMDLLNKIDELKKLSEQLPQFRMDKFVVALESFKPFKKSHRYKPYHMVYENYIENSVNYKLDVRFHKEGDAFVFFWIPKMKDEARLNSLQNKLQRIGYEDKMVRHENINKWVGYSKDFDFKEYHSLSKIDDAILNFVKEFLAALKNI